MEKDRPIRSQSSHLDRQEVVRVLAELDKISTGINQIARHLNGTHPPKNIENALELALRDLAELRMSCLQAIGQERHPDEE